MYGRRIRQLACFALSASVGLLGKDVPGSAQAEGRGTSEEETRMGRDEAYRRLFTILDSAEAALKQQPANLAAQANYLRDLEATLQAIRASHPEQPKPQSPTSPSTGPVAERATTATPGGPVTPSTRPSLQQDEERRREATAKFRGGGPLGRPYEEMTLSGVTDGWLLPACDRALARSRELRDRLGRDRVDREFIAAGLRQVRAAVQEISSPPNPRS